MTRSELRQALQRLLELETRADPDWHGIEGQALSLVRLLRADDEQTCPPTAYRFLDDVDIRRRDRGYADAQRGDLRAWLEAD